MYYLRTLGPIAIGHHHQRDLNDQEDGDDDG